MSVSHIAISIEAGDWPPERDLEALAIRAIGAAEKSLAEANDISPAELSLVFTDDAAMRRLNNKWRGKNSPTNVLSFPQIAALGPGQPGSRKSRRSEASVRLLGDVILSAETVAREATLADKPLVDHMAHLIIHGYLHLLGFDHEREADAEKMEQLERVALQVLGIPDPYAAASGE